MACLLSGCIACWSGLRFILEKQPKMILATNDSQYALMGNNPYAIIKISGKTDHDYEMNIPNFEL